MYLKLSYLYSWLASTALSGNRVLIHGGYNGDDALDDSFIFNLGMYLLEPLYIYAARFFYYAVIGGKICNPAFNLLLHLGRKNTCGIESPTVFAIDYFRFLIKLFDYHCFKIRVRGRECV